MYFRVSSSELRCVSVSSEQRKYQGKSYVAFNDERENNVPSSSQSPECRVNPDSINERPEIRVRTIDKRYICDMPFFDKRLGILSQKFTVCTRHPNQV